MGHVQTVFVLALASARLVCESRARRVQFGGAKSETNLPIHGSAFNPSGPIIRRVASARAARHRVLELRFKAPTISNNTGNVTLASLSKKDLQARLRALGKPVSGNKTVLIERLEVELGIKEKSPWQLEIEARKAAAQKKKKKKVPWKEPNMTAELCNVVLTHVNADFDSLAGAVALAKLWSIERPDYPTYVVMPQGANPLVMNFMNLHKHLFPVRGFSTIRAEDVRAVGIVDTQSPGRLGRAAEWLESAEWIEVFDHHSVQGHDHQQHDGMKCNEKHLEPVGSATTMIVERLQKLMEEDSSKLRLSEAEATLFSLGIRADTGTLLFAGTTQRDGQALVYLMGHGASQAAIAEFGQARLTERQRDFLAEAMGSAQLLTYEGVKTGIVQLDVGNTTAESATGMALVAEEMLQLMSIDALILGVVSRSKKEPFLSLIGRCSSRASSVDLNLIMKRWNGGGHAAAAAAHVRLDKQSNLKEEVTSVLQEALREMLLQLPKQPVAREIMNMNVITCSPDDTMDTVKHQMLQTSLKVMFVLDTHRRPVGVIKYPRVVKAERAGKGEQPVKAWMLRELSMVKLDTPLADIEDLLAEGRTGNLPVVDDDNVFLGLVTRNDVLDQQQLYDSISSRGHDGSVVWKQFTSPWTTPDLENFQNGDHHDWKLPESEHAASTSEIAASTTLQGEVCNVVLTHTNADFDSLAGAVALAKIWSVERPEHPTYVVMPQGAHQRVFRFQMYNKNLFPVRGFQTIRAEDVRAVGIIDTQLTHRLGPAADWLRNAEWVEIYDHYDSQRRPGEGFDDHQKQGDIQHNCRFIEAVGSVTTFLLERLRDLMFMRNQPLALSEAEATLFALGIREATGALSYHGTTVRDGQALVSLMEQGGSQVAIAEFGHDRLSETQRDLLAEAMRVMQVTVYEGIRIGIVQLNTSGFVTGMAVMAEELLHLMSLDVIVLGAVHQGSKKKAQSSLSLIGRCSSRASIVSLNSIMSRWKGGGHPSAAAASLRFKSHEEAQEAAAGVLQEALVQIKNRIPRQPTASQIMNRSPPVCLPDDTVDEVMQKMQQTSKKVMFIRSDDHKLLGMVKYPVVVKATMQGKGLTKVKMWMNRNLITIKQDASLAEIESILNQGKTGHLPVIDDANVLLGLVKRADLLDQRNMYGFNDMMEPPRSLDKLKRLGTFVWE